jgi:L-fuconate dehydratase
MNPEPDYSAAYVVVSTDAHDGLDGHGFAFTIGRGNDVQTMAIQALAPWIEGCDVDEVLGDLGSFGRRLTGDSHLRWLGPEKGVIHMAAGALLNALWDLRAKREGQPLWRLLSRMAPEALVEVVDFRYIADVLKPAEALSMLAVAQPGREEREDVLVHGGYPGYATSPGWLGYDDEKMASLARAAVDDGFRLIKLKVGGSLEDDVRRMTAVRMVVGEGTDVAIDANQRWDVDEAIAWVSELAPFSPYWIEEPTSPDDVLGHAAIRQAVAPIRVATGEHVQNRVMFKQLLMARAVDVVQIDACRVGGVNENLAILLLAAKFGVPVCPHAGGVGLCEMVQHLSMFDFVAVSGTQDDRFIEYVDHLHEHFVDPVVVRGGNFIAPTKPGYSTEMRRSSLDDHEFSDGRAWTASRGAERP